MLTSFFFRWGNFARFVYLFLWSSGRYIQDDGRLDVTLSDTLSTSSLQPMCEFDRKKLNYSIFFSKFVFWSVRIQRETSIAEWGQEDTHMLIIFLKSATRTTYILIYTWSIQTCMTVYLFVLDFNDFCLTSTKTFSSCQIEPFLHTIMCTCSNYVWLLSISP